MIDKVKLPEFNVFDLDGWNSNACRSFVAWIKKNKVELFKELVKEYDKWRRNK